MKNFLIVFQFVFLISGLVSQDKIEFKNPSFEGDAYLGKINDPEHKLLTDWIDCGGTWHVGESPYDIHTATSNYWNINAKPSHGKSFISLVVREGETYEGVSQHLESSLKKGKCYEFKIDLSHSEEMLSNVKVKPNKQKFEKNAILRTTFHNSLCQIHNPTTQSEPVNHIEWKTYTFKFKSKADYNYITLSAFWDTPTLFPYNGNILLDNLSPIQEINCDEINKD